MMEKSFNLFLCTLHSISLMQKTLLVLSAPQQKSLFVKHSKLREREKKTKDKVWVCSLLDRIFLFLYKIFFIHWRFPFFVHFFSLLCLYILFLLLKLVLLFKYNLHHSFLTLSPFSISVRFLFTLEISSQNKIFFHSMEKRFICFVFQKNKTR